MTDFRWGMLLGGFLVALGAAAVQVAGAQQTAPNVIPGCIYNATPPTLTDRQSTVLQCDVNGKLKVTTS